MDKGLTWTKLATPKLREADRIQIDNSAKIIYLGTAQAGVWRGIIDYSSSNAALIEATGVTVPISAGAGEEFPVVVSIDNTGGKAGSTPINLKIGEFSASKTAGLSSADQTTVSFSAVVKEKGDYDVFVNDLNYGKINIEGKSLLSVLFENKDSKINEQAVSREEKTEEEGGEEETIPKSEGKGYFGKLFQPVFWIIFAITAFIAGMKIAPKIFSRMGK